MKRILAADIGGTNSRFAYFEARGGELTFRDSVWIPTTEASSFADLFRLLKDGGFGLGLEGADACVLAVPGAVKDGCFAKPPNIAWDINLADLPDWKSGEARLINDFVAQAYACRTPAVDGAEPLLPGQGEENGVRAAIGAGTGLGHSALLPDGHGGWVAMASEAGHATFTFVGPGEQEFSSFLVQESGQDFAYGDLVVSGRGLSWVHQFLTGQELSPQEVSGVLDQHPDTVEWFARFYGRAARNYTLAVVALGGVYVMGGVAAKNPTLVRHEAFQKEFVNSPTYGWLLDAVPVQLVDNQDSGLWGAAFLGRQLLEQR